MRCLSRKLVSLATKVKSLGLTGLHFQDQLEAVLCMSLLIQMHIAACKEQVTILDRLIYLWQVFLEIRTGRLNCVERLQRLLHLHETVEVVLLLEQLSPFLVLALGLMKLAHQRRTILHC